METFLDWLYRVFQPQKHYRLCGSPGGPPVTAQRLRLKDGRWLAYAETGVPKDKAKFKIIHAHGLTGSRLDFLRASPEIIEEMGICIVGYDRAGHAESDPNPRKSLGSEASDVEELADAMELGQKFYLVGSSIGSYVVWACLKYIPHRLAGAAMAGPVINYRWPKFPKDLSKEAYNQMAVGDQWLLRVAYYAPWLLNWWVNQSWLPPPTVIQGNTFLPNRHDAEVLDRAISSGRFHQRRSISTLQGEHESVHRDILVMFGKWEFDPMDLPPPSFPVHIWQGCEDGIVPASLQNYISQRLGWIKYHEIPDGGHFLNAIPGFHDRLLKTLLLQS